eukprot:2186020-Rhodomonas_salina.2
MARLSADGTSRSPVSADAVPPVALARLRGASGIRAHACGPSVRGDVTPVKPLVQQRVSPEVGRHHQRLQRGVVRACRVLTT